MLHCRRVDLWPRGKGSWWTQQGSSLWLGMCGMAPDVGLEPTAGRVRGAAVEDATGLVTGHAINVPSCTEVEWIGIEIKPRMFELFLHQYSARCNHYQ